MTDVGFILYPLIFCALMVAVLSMRAIWRLRAGGSSAPSVLRSNIDGTLFWGAYAMLLGILGTVLGFIVVSQSAEGAASVEPVLVWGGIKIAMLPTAYGMLIFLVASLIWFGLRAWHRKAALAGA